MNLKTCRIYDRVPAGEIKLDITVGRNPKHVLAPSWEILNAFRDGSIDWRGYEARYRFLLQERFNTGRREEFIEILRLANETTVHLACFCGLQQNCHRNLAKAYLESIR